MSKKKKWNKRRRYQSTRNVGTNRHHLLYQRRHWTTPYAKQLRLAMVRQVPVRIHNELHNDVLRDIPKPAEKMLETAWKAYQSQKTQIDALNLQELILWLYNAIPDEGFRACMMVQYRFFDSELGGRY